MQLFDAEYRKDIPNVVRWYTTLMHFPHFDAVFVEKNLCKQRLKCGLLPALSLNDCAPHKSGKGWLGYQCTTLSPPSSCHLMNWVPLAYLSTCIRACVFLHRCVYMQLHESERLKVVETVS